MAGWLMVNYGWASAFYVPAVFASLLAVLWYFTVFNRPAEHPRISSDEKEYIESSLGDTITKRKVRVPKIIYFLRGFFY